MKFNPFKNLGPGTLVAAAFIGPGTVATCTKAGVGFGFALIWALILSTIATIVLQEIAARLGMVSQQGLASAVKKELKSKWVRVIAITLIISAILIGNTAYQAGNISGGVLGLATLFPDTQIIIGEFSVNYLILIFGGIAFLALFQGNYKLIERFLVALVLIMSVSFIITAILTKPDLTLIFKGAFIPTLPDGSLLTIVGLIGTTVVPYNLFLHAAIVREKWTITDNNFNHQLRKSKKDTIISIALGGVVSIAIIISAAAVQQIEITSATDLAKGLEPLYGNFAKYFLAIGMFAAGITSSITAPIAAAYVAKECFNWSSDLKSAKFRAVWMIVLFTGMLFAIVGTKPIEMIQFAQVANGLLMPIIALFLLWVVNRTSIMGDYVNSKFQNVLSSVIILITIGLLIKTIYSLFFS